MANSQVGIKLKMTSFCTYKTESIFRMPLKNFTLVRSALWVLMPVLVCCQNLQAQSYTKFTLNLVLYRRCPEAIGRRRVVEQIRQYNL